MKRKTLMEKKEGSGMKHWYIALVAFFIMSFCYHLAHADNWYAEVGAGYAFDTPWGTSMNERLHYDWKGSNPTAIIEVGREFDSGLVVKYQHVSNWLSGWPVNDERGTVLDQVVVSYRWKW